MADQCGDQMVAERSSTVQEMSWVYLVTGESVPAQRLRIGLNGGNCPSLREWEENLQCSPRSHFWVPQLF